MPLPLFRKLPQPWGLFLLFVMLLPSTALAGQLEMSTDRPGLDYSHFQLASPDPNLCMQACLDQAQCEAMTYVHPRNSGEQAHCWLKTGVPQAKASDCCVSWVKDSGAPPQGNGEDFQVEDLTMEKDVDRPGNDYTHFALAAPDPKLCMQACADDPKCMAYTYVKPTSSSAQARCWLKGQVPQAKPNKTCISGVKRTGGDQNGPGAADKGKPNLEYDPNRTGRLQTITLRSTTGDVLEQVTVEVLDGLAILDGDMVLGPKQYILNPAPVEETVPVTGDYNTRKSALLALSNRVFLWPNGVIPYEIDSELKSRPDQIKEIHSAVQTLNNDTNLHLVPRTNESVFLKYVKNDGDGTFADVGYPGWIHTFHVTSEVQEVNLASWATASDIIHETLHVAGCRHEQSRNDRDAYVKIIEDNVIGDKLHNFEKYVVAHKDMGPYDYESIMHYPEGAFCKTDITGSCVGKTIVALKPLPPNFLLGFASNLSSGDIDGVNALYPITLGFSGGHKWGGGNVPTAVAFGDIDGDGREEMAVARSTDQNDCFYILQLSPDPNSREPVIFSKSSDYFHGTCQATDIALGDVNGDGKDEIGVTLKTGKGNRVFILNPFDVRKPGHDVITPLHRAGSGWGSGNYATCIAFGNVDSDPAQEVAFGRKSDRNARFYLLDDQNHDFNPIDTDLGAEWGGNAYTTDIAFGDTLGDGRDELAVGRFISGDNPRWIVYSLENGKLRNIQSGGHKWTQFPHASATSVAFGNIDQDPKLELGVTGKTKGQNRFAILNDGDHGFGQIWPTPGFACPWGEDNYPTAIAFGDYDGDGIDEIGLSRRSDRNSRYYVFDDASNYFALLDSGGQNWGEDNYATGIAFGDANGDGKDDYGIIRKSNDNMRYALYLKGR